VTESFSAAIKIVFRNRQNIFWGFAFPLLFVLAFSLFKGGTQVDVKTEIVAPDSGPAAEVAARLQAALEESRPFEVRRAALSDGEEEFAGRIASDKVDLVVILENRPADDPSPVSLRVLYDEADVLKKEVAFATIASFVDQINLEAAGVKSGFTAATYTPIAARSINFFDFTLAGFIAYGVASISVIGISSAMVGYRDRQILKRLACTPVSPNRFVLAHVAARLLLASIQVIVIVAVARLLGAHIYGNPAWAVALVVLGNVIFLNFGLALAGVIRGGPEAASAAGTAITLPMFILSGSFFSLRGLPGPLRVFAESLPLTPLVGGTRKILLEEPSLSGLVPELLLIGVWIVISLALALASSRKLLTYDES
jgi:ABC-2 type transport system permease protein